LVLVVDHDFLVPPKTNVACCVGVVDVMVVLAGVMMTVVDVVWWPFFCPSPT